MITFDYLAITVSSIIKEKKRKGESCTYAQKIEVYEKLIIHVILLRDMVCGR